MKRGTDRIVKFKRLKVALRLGDWEIKGLLQSIWDFAAENALGGDIGRYSDEDIALGIDYSGDATALMNTLGRPVSLVSVSTRELSSVGSSSVDVSDRDAASSSPVS